MRAPMACAYFAFVSCDPWHVRSMLSLSFAINSSSDPPSEIEHGKFSGKAPFECTDCPFTVCLLPRLPVHPLPVHQLPAPRLPVPGHRIPRNERSPPISFGTLRVLSPISWNLRSSSSRGSSSSSSSSNSCLLYTSPSPRD